jgi:hypothetical protein
MMHAQVIPVPSFPGRVWVNGSNGSRILTGALVFTLVTAALSPTALLQESAQDSKKDPSERTFTNACAKCHPAERVTAMRRTRSQWEEVINTMITVRGAQVSDEDFDVVLGSSITRPARCAGPTSGADRRSRVFSARPATFCSREEAPATSWRSTPHPVTRSGRRG